MIDIEFDFHIAGENGADEPYLDEYELQTMFDHTRQQINQQVQTKLANVRCPDHDQPPRVKITGVYSAETEQLDIQYHIDTCCNLLLLKAVQALNH